MSDRNQPGNAVFFRQVRERGAEAREQVRDAHEAWRGKAGLRVMAASEILMMLG